MKNKKKKRLETSKKILIFTSICFAIVIAFVVAIFVFSLVLNISLDYTALITLVSVSGGVFGTSAGFYYNKAKAENLYKIKSSYLKIKYLILKDIDALDTSTIQAELQTELDKIECSLDEEESSLNQEITYDADT